MDIILIGAPGAGKGTQAEKFSQKLAQAQSIDQVQAMILQAVNECLEQK